MFRHLEGKTAWEKHVEMMKSFRDAEEAPAYMSDMDALRRAYSFLGTAETTASTGTTGGAGAAWGKKLAAAYCKKLFKEYALVHLERYEEGLIGMRWRVEKEVVAGKGQFMCGGLPGCREERGLYTIEVPFKYKEHGEKKEALVKVRLCSMCKWKLEYRRNAKRRKKEGLPPPVPPSQRLEQPVPSGAPTVHSVAPEDVRVLPGHAHGDNDSGPARAAPRMTLGEKRKRDVDDAAHERFHGEQDGRGSPSKDVKDDVDEFFREMFP